MQKKEDEYLNSQGLQLFTTKFKQWLDSKIFTTKNFEDSSITEVKLSDDVKQKLLTKNSYNSLDNKPTINGVELIGNKTDSDLKINYNNLLNKPTIPTKLSQLTNDKDFQNSTQVRAMTFNTSNYANDSVEETKLSSSVRSKLNKTIPIASSSTAGLVKAKTKTSSDTSEVAVDSSGKLWYQKTSSSLPIATSSTLGGVKAKARNNMEDNYEVAIDSNGKLWYSGINQGQGRNSIILNDRMATPFEVTGNYGTSIGFGNKIAQEYATAIGKYLTTDNNCQLVIGENNAIPYSPSFFIIGSGSGGSSSGRQNAFRVDYMGTHINGGTYNTTGADYAEMCEWNDGNILEEDRTGLFVEWIDNKVQIADKWSRKLAGVVSATPSVLGNCNEDDWQGKYLTDEWGRIIYKKDEIGKLRKIINTNFNENLKYIPRSKRKEYAPIGMLGQLLVKSDGSCEVGDFCMPKIGGIATKSFDENIGFLVLEKRNNNILKIYLNRF